MDILSIVALISNIIGCMFCIICLTSTFQMWSPLGHMMIPCLICTAFSMLNTYLWNLQHKKNRKKKKKT